MIFNLTDTLNQPIKHFEAMRRYKIYAREVSNVDLGQQGGFCLQGRMINLHGMDGDGNNAYRVSSSPEHNPVVFCVDMRDPTNTDPKTPVLGRFGFLMVHVKSCLLPVTKLSANRVEVYDGTIVSYIGDDPDWVCFASYYQYGNEPLARIIYVQNLASGFSPKAQRNPYRMIAVDLDAFMKSGALKINATPASDGGRAMNLITAGLKRDETIHDKFWLPSTYRFIGEVGGIMLFQNKLDPYAQPKFLFEVLAEFLDDIPFDQFDKLFEVAQEQAGRFSGAENLMKTIAMLLESKKEVRNMEQKESGTCMCGHEKNHHNSSTGCIFCSCMLDHNGQKLS